MTTHKTGTRDEWLAARLELLKAEKELTRRSDELARRRQELPWVRIDKEYRFDTDEGRASLADLFRGRSQLLVYHFMFGPDHAGEPIRLRTRARGRHERVRARGRSRVPHLLRLRARTGRDSGSVYQWLDRAPRGRNETYRPVASPRRVPEELRTCPYGL